ncbi:Four helix bundle protein [Candidatus Magnetomoraceae bacterium gMMP-15]
MTTKEDALTKTYDLMLWLFPQVSRFPRSYRFILGDRIENQLLNIQEKLIEARFTRNKIGILYSVNISLEQLRYLTRLCKDLQLVSIKKYEYMAREINSIGIFVGGWIKKLKRR